MTIPKLTETEANELKLDSYLMHVHRTICNGCACGERYGELFEVWIHPTKTRLTGFKQLHRATGNLKPDIPIEFVELPEQTVPVCSDCVHVYNTVAEPRPAISPEAWAETLKRKYAPVPREVKVARTTGAAANKKIPTLDEL